MRSRFTGLLLGLLLLPVVSWAALAEQRVLTWQYTLDDHQGHVVRQEKDGAMTELGRLAKGSGMELVAMVTAPGTYCWTAVPYNASGLGAPSNAVCETFVDVPQGSTTLTIRLTIQR